MYLEEEVKRNTTPEKRGCSTILDSSIFGYCGGFSLLTYSVASRWKHTRKTSANPTHATISILQEARVYETSVFWERTLFGSLRENSCPEHLSFVTQIYVTMEGPGVHLIVQRTWYVLRLDCCLLNLREFNPSVQRALFVEDSNVLRVASCLLGSVFVQVGAAIRPIPKLPRVEQTQGSTWSSSFERASADHCHLTRPRTMLIFCFSGAHCVPGFCTNKAGPAEGCLSCRFPFRPLAILLPFRRKHGGLKKTPQVTARARKA